MTLKLFFDTETTGLPDFGSPSEAEHQPHLVQLAAMLVDVTTRTTVASIDVVVRPNGWEIPEEVSLIHGITTEQAMSRGVDELMAVQLLLELWQNAQSRVAHNESFDARIIRIALKRYGAADLADTWKAAAAECTARLTTPILALPPTDRMKAAKRFHHKTPNLTEAYSFFFGAPFENAHSALADVQACRDVYFAAQDHAAKAAA